MPRLRLGKLAEETLCLGRPTTVSLTSQHDKPGPPVATSQLRIHRLISSARTQQRRPIHNLAARLWCAVPLQRRNKSGVEGELRSMEQ